MVNHIDDSRERPERAVSDTIREKGGFTDDPAERGDVKVMEDLSIKVASGALPPDRENEEDDDKRGDHVQRRREERRNRRINNRRRKNRNKRNNNTLKTAIERSEDAADAER